MRGIVILAVLGLSLKGQLAWSSSTSFDPIYFSGNYELYKNQNFPCEQSKLTEFESFQCLEDFANDSLLASSQTKIYSSENAQGQLDRELKLSLRDWGLELNQSGALSLSQMFRYEIYRDLSTKEREAACFIEEWRDLDSEEKSLFVSNFKNQIQQINRFLIHYHKTNLGQVRSILFAIRAIKLCDKEVFQDRSLSHRGVDLFVGVDTEDLHSKSYSPIMAESLLRDWDSSKAILYLEKGYWDESVFSRVWPYEKLIKYKRIKDHYENSAPEGIIYDVLAEYWMILNPIGDLRKTTRVAVQKLREALLKNSEKDPSCEVEDCTLKLHKSRWRKILDGSDGKGFTDSQREFVQMLEEPRSENIQAVKKIYEEWQANIKNPAHVFRSIESALLSSSSGGSTSSISIMDRIYKCVIAVGNNHSIKVDLSSLLAISAFPPIDRFHSEEPLQLVSNYTKFQREGVELVSNGNITYNENTDENYGFVCVNTSDIVEVNLKFPRVTRDSILGLNLFLSLQSYMERENLGIVSHQP